VGFSVAEDLHLLSHEMEEIPPVEVPGVALRRARSADRERVLAVDHLAFQPFWRLDDGGLDEAINATPHARFRIAHREDDERVVGYAVTGRAGRRGYVQRIAVDPAEHGNGIGRLLVVDGLRWLRRWRVERAMVNTQLDNSRALGLYEALGFRRERTRLSVLGIELC
jgi:ribosomal protein S18 acetylase RimI-like enzyme